MSVSPVEKTLFYMRAAQNRKSSILPKLCMRRRLSKTHYSTLYRKKKKRKKRKKKFMFMYISVYGNMLDF